MARFLRVAPRAFPVRSGIWASILAISFLIHASIVASIFVASFIFAGWCMWGRILAIIL